MGLSGLEGDSYFSSIRSEVEVCKFLSLFNLKIVRVKDLNTKYNAKDE